jgi:hypothetical protein
MERPYLCTLTGTGTATDPWYPVGFQPGAAAAWRAIDARPNPSLGAGKFLVLCDTTPAHHTTLLATAGVTYLPFDDASGTPVAFGSPLSAVSAANRSALVTRLEAEHVPASDFIATDNKVAVFRRIVRRFLLRQRLGADDWSELLDSTVSAMNATKRQRINTALQGWGIDTSAIQGTDTIRTALRLVTSQLVDAVRSPELD